MQVTVGRIGRPYGVRGYVAVSVRTDEPEQRFAVGSRLDTDPPASGPLTVAAARWHSGELVVRFQGIRDRDAAASLRGTWLSVDSGTLEPPEDPDEFRDHDLIGLAVRTADGSPVGEVTDVLHYGQDLLVIGSNRSASASGPGGGTGGGGTGGGGTAAARTRPAEILVPFVKAIVTDVDLAAGVLVIDPPPGLLDPDEAV